MAAIVRVKRRRDEDPVESIVVKCKRKKESDHMIDESNIDESVDVKSVFKFAGTIAGKELGVVGPVREAIRQEKLQREYRRHLALGDVATVAKRRARKAQARQARYQVVSQKRTTQLDELDTNVSQVNSELVDGAAKTDTAAHRLFTLCDVEPRQEESQPMMLQAAENEVITCNGLPLVREKLSGAEAIAPLAADEFVYDIYYMNNAGFDFRLLEQVLAVEALKAEELLPYEDPDRLAEVNDEDEDSNDEGNWRNDYPDEDPGFYEKDGSSSGYSDSYDDDCWDLSERLQKGLAMSGEAPGAGLQFHTSGAASAGVSDLWTPRHTYENYKAKVTQELKIDTGQVEDMDADDEDIFS